ncbi:MAG: hypothetical protein IJI66_03405 [Erysipelotrichaceae bacterium]|nr:hypothetical protein [Erysipelotrichaceae bacterium]
MKKKEKIIAIVLVIFLFLFWYFTNSRTKDAKTINTDSEVYSDFEINNAIFSAKLYFALNFKNCRLIDIGYAGDESVVAAQEWAKDFHAGKVIILTSSFETDDKRGDGSLMPDKVYEGWQWIMVKRFGFLWLHKTHGYG